MSKGVTGQLPTRTAPHQDNSPPGRFTTKTGDELSWCGILVYWGVALGISGELSWWEIILVGSCPRGELS